jgi:prefoldin subunit 5
MVFDREKQDLDRNRQELEKRLNELGLRYETSQRDNQGLAGQVR